MPRKNIKVTKETKTGLNKEFFDPSKNKSMNRSKFANEIGKKNYPGYHIMQKEIGGKKVKVPRSNPDKSAKNNLG